jgi:hypothetical protein
MLWLDMAGLNLSRSAIITTLGISKRGEETHRACSSRDVEGSAHARTQSHPQGAGSQYLGEMVFGRLDGIITAFAVVSGVAGAQPGTPEDEGNPLANELVSFGSFVVAGAVPLLTYLLGLAFPAPSQGFIPISLCCPSWQHWLLTWPARC